jgi:L-2,4-diaminobutyrate decarboxylase
MCPQPASFYEAGQLANVADKILQEEFSRWLGWAPGNGDMIVTSGGSLANLTAILAARNDRLPGSWSTGVAKASRQVPMIAVSEDIHYSVDRVAGIIGIGQEGVVRLPLDAKRRICLSSADAMLSNVRAAGGEVFCLVASAGSTPIGAIDPLDGLAHLAQAHGAWLHIDGSHSGAFLVSDRLRPRLQGIERADSFCLDAHKTLFVPALCTLLFYRDRAKARRPFSQEASYVFDDHQDPISLIESGAKNFECTKRPAVLNLWLVWAMYGSRAIADKLEYLVDLTREAYEYLSETPDFRTIHEPESNILCFEHRPKGLPEEHISALQVALRDRIRSDGTFFLSKVEIGGRNVLRIVLMNHEITIDHIADLVVEIRRAAHSILQMPDWPAVAMHRGAH